MYGHCLFIGQNFEEHLTGCFTGEIFCLNLYKYKEITFGLPVFFFFILSLSSPKFNVLQKFENFRNEIVVIVNVTRMHSSMMRTVRSSGRRGRGWAVCPGGVSA